MAEPNVPPVLPAAARRFRIGLLGSVFSLAALAAILILVVFKPG